MTQASRAGSVLSGLRRGLLNAIYCRNNYHSLCKFIISMDILSEKSELDTTMRVMAITTATAARAAWRLRGE
jgi:hypothetical protein